MIQINFSTYLDEPDALIVARNAIFQAMFERTANQLELDVYCNSEDRYTDIHVDELTHVMATQFVELLEQVGILSYITVESATPEELEVLSRFGNKVAMEVVPLLNFGLLREAA